MGTAMRKTVSCLLGVVLVGITAGAEMRTWTSKNGDNIKAEYKSMFPGNKVVLKSADGRVLKVPVAELCAEDQAYLADIVPPKIDIHVDVDIDRDSEFEVDGYRRQRETVKCSVTVKKTSTEPCSREFTAYIYVFAEKYHADIHGLISCAKGAFSFKNDSKVFCLQTSPASVEYVKSSFMDNKGFRYEGYIAVVEDNAGNVVGMRSTRNLYEKSWGKIRGAHQGVSFDRQFDVMDGVQHRAWN